jgi:hypothetical protein
MERNQNATRPDEPEKPAPLEAGDAESSGLLYPSGSPIPPTHPDHGPMHLLPRQEDGSFAAYHYCSNEELEAAGVDGPPPRRHRRDGFTPERQAEFVEHLQATGSVTDAARLTGISRTAVYNLYNRADAAAFRAAVDEALKGVDFLLESTAIDRAVNGQEEIVYHRGQRVGVRWRYDNRLLMSLLRARNPLKYAPLSEIEGWLARRGLPPPADLPAALDRLRAAEAEWGRGLPSEAPVLSHVEAPAAPKLTLEAPAKALEWPLRTSSEEAAPAPAPSHASTSST